MKRGCATPGVGAGQQEDGRYAQACVLLLGLLVLLISWQNGQHLARGYFLHLLPMLLVCGTAWTLLRPARPPQPGRVFLALCAASVACIVLEPVFHIYKRRPFDEDGALTLLSFCLLLLTSMLTFRIWRLRKGADAFRLLDKRTIWLLMAVGFLYLAVDEKSLLHEGVDISLHKMLGITPDAFTSRLDDLLIGLYGLIGMAALWLYRAEILRFPSCLRLLVIGFAGLFLSVLSDTVSSRSDFLEAWLGQDMGLLAYDVFEALDEIFKVASEVLFLTGFARALPEALPGSVKGVWPVGEGRA